MGWQNVSFLTDAAHAEPMCDVLLEAGALSASIEDADAGTADEKPQFGEPGSVNSPGWVHSRVVALFEPDADVAALLAQASAAIGLTGVPAWTVEAVAEQNWVQLTQSQFDPIRINERLWIVPSWHAAPDPDAVNLVLDPGLAFGTGSHPTTFLCLQWLSDTLRGKPPGQLSVLDYGCGSGILGIAAARLGAATVLGVDIDDNALIAARSNADNNKVSLQLRHSKETLAEQFDIVVANILTNPLCVLAPLLAGRIAPGGRIALAGVLASQAQQVIDAYAPLLALKVGAERDGWVRLEGSRC